MEVGESIIVRAPFAREPERLIMRSAKKNARIVPEWATTRTHIDNFIPRMMDAQDVRVRYILSPSFASVKNCEAE